MKTKTQLLTVCVTALALLAPLAANGATPTPMASASPKTKASPAPKTADSPAANATTETTKVRAIPFHGMISAVDAKANTFTIAGKETSRVFKVTDKTVLTKAGAPATMKDVVANEEARGSYWKHADGTLEAKSVKLGPKTDAEKAADEKSKSKKKSKDKAKDKEEEAEPNS